MARKLLQFPTYPFVQYIGRLILFRLLSFLRRIHFLRQRSGRCPDVQLAGYDVGDG